MLDELAQTLGPQLQPTLVATGETWHQCWAHKAIGGQVSGRVQVITVISVLMAVVQKNNMHNQGAPQDIDA